ncbi:MAG: helix-turn-helix transcriptional regulator [Rhodomicrobium sp.]
MAHYAIESFIEATNSAKTSGEVCRLFGDALNGLGYDRFCYSLITDHPSLGLEAGHGIAKNYPDDWMSHYEANNYVKKDPVPRYGLSTSRPFTWESVVKAYDLEPEQKKVMNEAKEARLLDGIAIPICGHNGELAGIGVASSTGGVRPDLNLLSKIQYLSLQFHAAYTELEKHGRTMHHLPVRLTVREREILSWAAEGKSDSVIAELLGISHATIRFHMKNVFKKLNANERTLATVKALRLGLILPSYVG